jgi:head-tail adaptor
MTAICQVPDPAEFDTSVQFEPPNTESNALNEIDAHDRQPAQYEPWCKVRTRGSREVYFAEQSHGQLDVVVECEYFADLEEVTTDWRMVIGTDVFEIIGKPENVNYQNTLMRFVGRHTE